MLNERRATLILTRLVPVVSSYVLHLHVAQSSSSVVTNPIHFLVSLSSTTHAKSQISKRTVFRVQRHYETATTPNRSAASSDRRSARKTCGEMLRRRRVTATDHGRETSATEALIIVITILSRIIITKILIAKI